jgi:hypothetical protein
MAISRVDAQDAPISMNIGLVGAKWKTTVWQRAAHKKASVPVKILLPRTENDCQFSVLDRQDMWIALVKIPSLCPEFLGIYRI